MTRFPSVLGFVALTFFCWGIYGPVLHEGQYGLGDADGPSSLRPFICVGIAYFLIAVIVPIIWLKTKGEKGHWTASGTIWSLAAGAAGAIGALGITMAFKSRGNPMYVMPLVFGLAPVVNTFVTMWMNRTFKEAGTIFYIGVAIVAIGGAGVMFFKPQAKNIKVETNDAGGIRVTITSQTDAGTTTTVYPDKDSYVANLEELQQNKSAYKAYMKTRPISGSQRLLIALSIATTALCWGSYGPVLHKGQMKMSGSRLRPLLCVGLAYFAIAVIVPTMLLGVIQEPGGWNIGGAFWSLAAGAAGAVGALGIIMAFTFGGKPIFVMPLVFGCAPVVNTITTVLSEGTTSQVPNAFLASLLLVIIGAVTVLVFAPKGHKPSAAGTPKLKQRKVKEPKPALTPPAEEGVGGVSDPQDEVDAVEEGKGENSSTEPAP